MHDAVDDPLRLPPPPPAPARPAVPIAAALVPVVGAVVLWRLTGSSYALWFAALGPLMALAAFADGLRTQRRDRRRSARAGAAALAELQREIEVRHHRESERAAQRTPDVAGYAARPDEIWRAVPGRADVLVVGRGVVPSSLRLDGEASDEAGRELRRRARELEDAPVTVPLTAGVAVCGPVLAATAVVRALALQACLGHAPARLRMPGAADELAALPHREATRGAVLFVGEGGRPVPDDVDIPLVRVSAGAPPPPRCAAVLTLTGPDRARLDHDGRSSEVRVEAVSVAQAWSVAGMLAERARTIGQRIDAAPDFADLPALRGGRGSLAAAIGVAAGEPVVLDLVADGPHAVVIGVTGSGKSELLTTWIAALCRTRTPQEVAFLLVDFKGGRTFDALADLPHVTGVLTDLDEARALRAVESLRAEIRHRERVLAEAGAREIADGVEELSRLVIVVDEYAALVAAHPELHDLFADIAARGRGLGLHLILASQRAAGAFRDGVLANAPLRIALRVTDAADSRAVLDVDEAARLPGGESGRGMALVRRAADGAPSPVRVARCDAAALGEILAAAAEQPRARRPWQPPLPERIELTALRRMSGSGGILLGLADEPDRQRQTVVALPAGASGFVVVGAAGSGRSTLLRTIAGQVAQPVWVPGDAEGAWDALARLDAVPHGAVILIDDADAVAGRLPGEHGAVWLAALELACLQARGRGITIVAAVARVTGALGRALEVLPHRALLPLATRADHVAAGGEAGDFIADAAAGRGRWGRRLVQFASPDDADVPPDVRVGRQAAGAALRTRDGRAPQLRLDAPRSLALVVPPGPRAQALREACRRAGRDVVEVGVARASAGLSDARTAVFGAPEAWLAQWRLLEVARATCDLVVDVACAAEYRAVTGCRELPPYALPGRQRAWLHTPADEGACRVRLPVPG